MTRKIPFISVHLRDPTRDGQSAEDVLPNIDLVKKEGPEGKLLSSEGLPGQQQQVGDGRLEATPALFSRLEDCGNGKGSSMPRLETG